uniref:Bee-milk protein n=1 Tax=Megaselia scalaris TaxID=36166 RepID=T1GIT0_MEGSC
MTSLMSLDGMLNRLIALNSLFLCGVSYAEKEEIWTKGVSVWRSNNKFASKKSEYGNNLEERFTYINVNKFFQVVGSDESLVGSYCDMDRKAGIYYCTSPKARGILAWDIKKPFNFRLVVRNNELLEYPGILRIVEYVKGETEVVTSTSNII